MEHGRTTITRTIKIAVTDTPTQTSPRTWIGETTTVGVVAPRRLPSILL